MSKLIVYLGDNPQCIEGFSASCKRTNPGALHLLPRKQKTITDDEYAHIVEKQKDVAAKIRLIANKPDSDVAEQAAPEAVQEKPSEVEKKVEKVAEPVASAVEASSDSFGNKKKK